MEHINQRDKDLISRYRFLRSSDDNFNKMPLYAQCDMVASSPAPRFYVTLQVAWRSINKIKRGINPSPINQRKAQMYYDLYNVYLEKKRTMHRCTQEQFIILAALRSPAKSFYVSGLCVKNRIFQKSARW